MKRRVRFGPCEVRSYDPKDRTVDVVIVTRGVKRDGLDIHPEGLENREEYMRNPVVFMNHDWRHVVARTTDLEVTEEQVSGRAQLARTRLVQEELEPLLADQMIHTNSVGWEYVDGHYDEATKTEHVTRWRMLEWSFVTVPADPEAIIQYARSRGMTWLGEALGGGQRGVIAYQKTPLAPEDASWRAGEEVRAATTEDLRVMCAWYDSERPDVKASYKLPHHRAAGEHECVWRGVASAMTSLMGGRGGVDVPEGDRQGIYNHLVRHYKEFEKDPPEFAAFNEVTWRSGEQEIFEEQDVVQRVTDAARVLVGARDIMRHWTKEERDVPATVMEAIRSLRDGAQDLLVVPEAERQMTRIYELLGVSDPDQVLQLIQALQ